MTRIPKRLISCVGLCLIVLLGTEYAAAQSSGGGQCSRSGSGSSGPTGSLARLNSSMPYASNTLTSNYPSSVGLVALQYQQRAAQLQNQIYSMVYQNAQRERLARLARAENAMPTRLARAEAKRSERAARAAARIAEREMKPKYDSAGDYSFTSATTE